MAKKRKVVWGLTGGIASGKTSVLRILKKKGIETFDCDRMAREVVCPGEIAFKKIVKRFGPQIVDEDGCLNRKKLGEIVFENKCLRKDLEKIVHPQVVRRLKSAIKRSDSDRMVVDIPLLFEAQLSDLVDHILVVWVPSSVQCKRLMLRDGFSKKEALNRIQLQWSLDRKKQRADVVIDNSKTPKETQRQVQLFLEKMRR